MDLWWISTRRGRLFTNTNRRLLYLMGIVDCLAVVVGSTYPAPPFALKLERVPVTEVNCWLHSSSSPHLLFFNLHIKHRECLWVNSTTDSHFCFHIWGFPKTFLLQLVSLFLLSVSLFLFLSVCLLLLLLVSSARDVRLQLSVRLGLIAYPNLQLGKVQ